MQIERYVAAQPPDVQAVFRLHIYGEHSFAEIAASLGQQEAAVKARYYRFMDKLRKEFTNYDGA